MQQILFFVAVFLAGLLHSLPVEPEAQLDLFSLEPDPLGESVPTNLDLSYQTGEADDIFSSGAPDEFGLNDFNSPILASDGASSIVAQCVGESIEPINVARSLDSLQPFDIAAEQDAFCLNDGHGESQTKLTFPTPQDLYNLNKLKPGGEIPPLNEVRGIWYCASPNAIVLCCTGRRNWDMSRQGCSRCKFEKSLSSGFRTSSRVSCQIY